MKLTCVSFLLALLLTTPVLGQKDFYSRRWARIYKYETKDLPKSASKVLDTLYQQARKDNNPVQRVKTLIYQAKFALDLEQDAELRIIERLKLEIEASRIPVRNLLESVLANVYWQYYKANKYKFESVTPSSEGDQHPDFRVWDRSTIIREIRFHFRKSLDQSTILQKIPLGNFDELLDLAENSKLYRPTLYDFLIQEFIAFGTSESGLPGIGRSAVDFDPDRLLQKTHPDSLWQYTDSLTLWRETFRTILEVREFHRLDKNPAPLIAIEIQRLRFLADLFDPAYRDQMQLTQFRKIRSIYYNDSSSTRLAYEMASLLNSMTGADDPEDNLGNSEDNQSRRWLRKEALQLCEKAIRQFPKSDGSRRCEALMNNILHKHLSIRAKKFISVAQYSRLEIEYANVDSLEITIFNYLDDELDRGQSDSVLLAALGKLTDVRHWKVQLRNPGDYQRHRTEVVIPPLPSGSYLIYVKVQTDNMQQIMGTAQVQVTNLALLKESHEGAVRLQLVNRNTGHPLSGGAITLLDDKSKTVLESITDGQGYIKDVSAKNIRTARVIYGEEKVTFDRINLWSYSYNEDDKKGREAFVRLFTDRSIYRPGQTIYFKGILFERIEGKSEAVGGEYVQVELLDVNSDEVGKLRLKSNSFGSFSGEFKIPGNGLTGEYSITADEDDEGSRFWDDVINFEFAEEIISVEDYKRPTFEVSFLPIVTAYRLNDSVRVTLEARSFSGAKVSGAKVEYQVALESQYSYGRRGIHGMTIREGSGMTDQDGQLHIQFLAEAKPGIPIKHHPVLTFTVEADVTDITGETRTQETQVRIGPSRQHILLVTNYQIDRTKPFEVGIRSENTNGEQAPSEGLLRIYRVPAPTVPQVKKRWNAFAPDLPVIDQSTFERLFPHECYAEIDNPDEFREGVPAYSQRFKTKGASQIIIPDVSKWPVGKYLLEVQAAGIQGDSSRYRRFITLYDMASSQVPDQQLLILQVDKKGYIPGEVAKIRIGSASPDITVTINVETTSGSKTYVQHLSNEYKEILVPVSAYMTGGFSVHARAVAYNSFVHDDILVQVTDPGQKLTIEANTFQDKLAPGSKPMWSFTIQGQDGEKAEAEVLASMYDASLDQFKTHGWIFQPRLGQFIPHNNRVDDLENFDLKHFGIRNQTLLQPATRAYYFDAWDWFGFSISRDKWIKTQYLNRLYINTFDSIAKSSVHQRTNRSIPRGKVAGTVISDLDGTPIAGVNVYVRGTAVGTITDTGGRYEINANRGDELVFSFIGYSTITAKVGNRNNIDVQLGEDIQRLSDIVVTAQGIEREQKSLGYAQTTIVRSNSEADYEFGRILQGRTPGLSVMNVSGMAGSGSVINIRGTTSISGNSEPLFVVDGVPVKGMTINSNDIAKIEVLRGSNAVVLYGSSGKNGVVLVTTHSGQKKIDEELAKVNIRKNLQETAFFLPHLTTDENGRIRFSFTTPESLTRWKLLLLAHTRDMATDILQLQVVTEKTLMVVPHTPRFFRQGDRVIFSAKITNLVSRALEGFATLQLMDGVSGKAIDIFETGGRNQAFKVGPKSNTELSWPLKIPSGLDAIQYRIIAKAGKFSDGEQSIIPVLSNRVLVTETLPMNVRGGTTGVFRMPKLDSGAMIRQSHQLTLEVTSNPIWNAIKSIPYLMEYPYECAEQTFERYFANAVAGHIIRTKPQIREVFDSWANQETHTSNLELNQELKSLLVEETPWVRDMQEEEVQRKNMGLLFNGNSLDLQLKATLDKLSAMQMPSGAFPWFQGGEYPNQYITQHIVAGVGHLRKIHALPDSAALEIARKAIVYLDKEIAESYGRLASMKAEVRERNHTTDLITHYLYARSFFPEFAVTGKLQPAVKYFLHQGGQYWTSFGLYAKAMTALVQYRNGNSVVAGDIMSSLKENSIHSDELGMYWKDNVSGWNWYQSPVEIQARMIEAFNEIESTNLSQTTKDKSSILDELRVWLLKNKQTSQWSTTKATAEAIYALLHTGTDWQGTQSVDVTIGNKPLAEAGGTQGGESRIGYIKTTWHRGDIKPELANVRLTKREPGIAWGAAYWQYFENLDSVTPSQPSIRLEKKLYLVKTSSTGEVLIPVVAGVPVKIGSLIRVRIQLTSDRTIDFVHLKDMRASGLEPVDVISGYHHQAGIWYYQSTRDAATNFFFDRINPGAYVFEYDLRASQKGDFANGFTTIQAMYAPEFSSHSSGNRIQVD